MAGRPERASHRRDRIHSYFELAHYHHPHLELALTYLTPPMEYVYAPESGIYGQVTWADVKPLIRSAWSQPSNASEVAVVDGLCDLIDNLHQPPSEWLTELRDTDSVPTLHHEAVGEAMSLAASTASDGSQRAIGYRADGLNELIDLRIEMRDAIAASAEDSPLRHVRPWVWTENSGGSALTAEGGELGAELRLSRYQHPI